MDDQEFRTRLSEVAHWTIPETPRETSVNAKKTRGRKSQEDACCEMHQEQFGGANSTYPPMLTRVKTAAVDCNDCGQHCANGRQQEAKIHQGNNTLHWRQRCVTCNRSKNPFTGAFELRPGESSLVWAEFLRGTKGVYQTTKNTARTTASSTASSTRLDMKSQNIGNVQTFEDDTCVIKIFTDSNLP